MASKRLRSTWCSLSLGDSHYTAWDAILVTVIAFLSVMLASFWAGKLIEQRSQLGYLVVAGPALEDLTAATRSADSLSMQMLLRLHRCKR